MCISEHSKQIVEGSLLVPSNFKAMVKMGTPIREVSVPVHLFIYLLVLETKVLPGFYSSAGARAKCRWRVVFFAGGRAFQDISIWKLPDIMAIQFK